MSESPNFISTKALGKVNKGSPHVGQKEPNTHSWGRSNKDNLICEKTTKQKTCLIIGCWKISTVQNNYFKINFDF
jgi:hypothetical protein